MKLLVSLFLALVFTAAAPGAVDVGDKPAIDFTPLKGEKITSESLKRWLVVLVFWSTDDDYTLREAAAINKSFTSYGRRGVRFIGVNLDKDLEAMQKELRLKKINWPQVADGKGWDSPTVKAWEPRGAPHAYILSPEGEVLWSGHPRSMEGTLDAALRDYPPSVPREAWVELTLAQLGEINKMLEANTDAQDYREPLRLLGELNDQTLDDPKVVVALKKMLRYFDSTKEQDKYSLKGYLEGEPEGAAMLQRVREAIHGVAATQAATQPDKAAAAKQNAMAQGKLTSANRYRSAKNHIDAYRFYRQVIDDFPDTPAAKVAEPKVKEYEADAEFMARYKVAAKEREAEELLKAAQAYTRAGKADLAEEHYQRVIDEFPDTPAAKKARVVLKQK